MFYNRELGCIEYGYGNVYRFYIMEEDATLVVYRVTRTEKVLVEGTKVALDIVGNGLVARCYRGGKFTEATSKVVQVEPGSTYFVTEFLQDLLFVDREKELGIDDDTVQEIMERKEFQNILSEETEKMPN